MKHLFSWLMSSLLLSLFTIACKKENIENRIPVNTNRYAQAQQHVVRLVVNHWEKNSDGNFVSSFSEVLRYYGNSVTIKVFLLNDAGEILISQGAINFKDGKLWSTVSGGDLKLIFSPGNGSRELPFDRLEIKVVFTQ